MMKFSEYAQQRDQQINEGWGDAFRNAGRITNGVVSGVGRTPIQAVKGLGNMAGGAAQGGWGAAQTAAGLGKGVLGGGWDTAGNGMRNMGRGVGRFASGVGQGLAAGTGATALGRGIVAANSPEDRDGFGQAPNYNDQNSWGTFKNWMGWQGKPAKPEAEEIPNNAWIPERRSRQRPGSNQPQSPVQNQGSNQTEPTDAERRQAFLKKYPGLNQQGLASAPLQSTARKPVTSTIGNLDDYESAQDWDPRTGNKRVPQQGQAMPTPSAVTSAWNQGSSAASQIGTPPTPQEPWQRNPITSPPLAPLKTGSSSSVIPSRPTPDPANQPSPPIMKRRQPEQIPQSIFGSQFMHNERKLGRWDGESPLQPYQAQGALKNIETFINQSQHDPKNLETLQKAAAYLKRILNRS